MSVMTIHECERKAKAAGFDSLRFTALFPSGPKVCRWLDAYMGALLIDGMDGFVLSSDLDETFPGLMCIPIEEVA